MDIDHDKKGIRFSIIFQATGFMTLALIVILSLFSFQIKKHYEEQLIESELTRLQEKTEELKVQIEGNLDDLLSEVREQLKLQSPHIPDSRIISIELYSKTGTVLKLKEQLFNTSELHEQKLGKDFIQTAHLQNPFTAVIEALNGKPVAFNASFEGGPAMVTYYLPLIDNTRGDEFIVLDLKLQAFEKLVKIYSKDSQEFFLLNETNTVVAHPNDHLVLRHFELHDDIAAKEATKTNLTKNYMQNENFLGAFSKSKYDLLIIGEISKKIVLLKVQVLERKLLKLSSLIIFAMMLLMAFVTKPIARKLNEVSNSLEKIGRGSLDIRVSRDFKNEIGLVAQNLDEMVDRLKASGAKSKALRNFIGTRIENQFLAKNTLLEPEKKLITILNANLLGFSQPFDKNTSAINLVSTFNDFILAIYDCTKQLQGSLCRFNESEFVVIWGDSQNPEDDANRAVLLALELRKSLVNVNSKRKISKVDPVFLAMGIHQGPVAFGVLGGETQSNREFSFIGAASTYARHLANFAITNGVDLALSPAISRSVKSSFSLEPFKGQDVNRVNGYIDSEGKFLELTTPFSTYSPKIIEKYKAG